MADGHFPTLVSATRDANAATNPLFTSLTDGTTAATFTGSSLNVNITGGSSSATEYAEDSAAVSGDLGIQALAVRQDTLAASTSADGDYTPLKSNAAGALYVSVSGSVVVTATDLDIRDLTATDVVTVVQPTGTNLHVVTDSGSTTAVTGNVTVVQPTGTNLHVVVDSGAITVSATDLDIRDLTLAQDAVKVSANSTANSATNPIFVKEVDAVVSNEVHSYNTASAVASDATSNHDYTVTGTTFLLRSVKFACSGGGKVEIQTGPVASLATVCVGFISKEGGICQIDFNPPKEVPVTSTGTVRLIRTNRQGQAQDLYSTIIGNDIP
jgi:hypothetical protein